MDELKRIRLLIDLLQYQLLIADNPNDIETINERQQRLQEAVSKLVNDYDGEISHRLDLTDGISHINVDVSISAKAYIDEDIPDYLPMDIFLRLSGKHISEMIEILRGYSMPEDEIKPFLRRIFPADDAL